MVASSRPSIYVLLSRSGSRNGAIHQHDVRVAQHNVATLMAHAQEVCGLAWSPGGNQLASGGNDNVLNIWDVNIQSSGEINEPLHTIADHCAAVKVGLKSKYSMGGSTPPFSKFMRDALRDNTRIFFPNRLSKFEFFLHLVLFLVLLFSRRSHGVHGSTIFSLVGVELQTGTSNYGTPILGHVCRVLIPSHRYISR